jgi:hypothetical protein
MARYKEYDFSQGKFIPVHFDKQILPGAFEYTLHFLIDNIVEWGRITDSFACEYREKCLRHPERQEYRKVYFFVGSAVGKAETYTQKMKRKIDSLKGRLIYNRRLGISEPPLAHTNNYEPS